MTEVLKGANVFINYVVKTFIYILLYFRYDLIVKKCKAQMGEIGTVLGNPKYFEVLVDNVKQQVFEREKESTSTIASGPSTSTALESQHLTCSTLLDSLTVDDDELLLNISDEILGMSPERKKQNDQNRELIKYLQRDLTDYEIEKLDLVKKGKSLLSQFHLLQKEKNETAKRIASIKNELMVLDAELEEIQKTIVKIEAKKKLLL